MEQNEPSPQTIDEYIARFPPEVQALLSRVRAVIHEAAPEATERISYGMPCFYLNGNLVYFAAAKHHLGFYPTGAGVQVFQDQLEGYKWSKGAIQFPYDRPIPFDLIARITRYRVAENLNKPSRTKRK